MSYSFFEFNSVSSGVCCEYELFLNYNSNDNQDLVEFGFAKQDKTPLFKFFAKNGKLYDNDANFVYHLGNQEGDIEIYGNIFNSYHNYSIDRVPVNTNCSKVEGVDVFYFFMTEGGLTFSLRVLDRV